MPKVSVVVPVYQNAMYLRKCIDSIINQTCTELEIILIDDGSTDGSAEICDEYVQKDSRIHVIHMPNSGVSKARNKGIELATGDYIGFVDSDDYISEEMYATYVGFAEKYDVDIVYGETCFIDVSGKQTVNQSEIIKENHLFFKKDWSIDLLSQLVGGVVQGIYRRSLIQNNAICFPEEMTFSEDRVFNIRAVGSANGIFYVKEHFYHINVNENSCTHSFRKNQVGLAKHAKEIIEDAFKNYFGRLEYLPLTNRQYIDACMYGIQSLNAKNCDCSMKEKHSFIRQVCYDEELQDAFARYGATHFLEKIVQRKYVWLVYIVNSRVVRYIYKAVSLR